MSHNQMYEASLKKPGSIFGRILYTTWLVVGLGGLMAIAWAEPVSGLTFKYLLSRGVSPFLVNYVGVTVVMALRAALLVESLGYFYHRFFQHVGFFTRRALVFRRNQRYHWMHHMLIYPIGRFYVRAQAYIASEKGVALSWVIPGVITAVLFTLTNGVKFGTFVFLVALWAYAKGVVDLTHSRFHEVKHPWVDSTYFQWLEEIHLLHHWDQNTNFTIVHPAMDVLFGTYLAPKTHAAELKIALEDHDLTVSDLINWRYLLLEATPAERAVFVSRAKKQSRQSKKVRILLDILKERVESHPQDADAKLFYGNAVAFMRELGEDVGQYE